MSADDGSENDPTHSFEAVVAVDVIDDHLDRMNSVFDGRGVCKIHLDDERIWSKVIHPANVAMASLSLDASAFESYDPPESAESVIGVSIDRMQEVLSVANKGDLVHLGLNAETGKLHLSLPNAGVEFDLALIDPGSIRQEPDNADLDLPVEVAFEAAWLQRGVKVGDMVSDHITISSDGDRGHEPNLSFSGEGGIHSGTTKLGSEDMIDGTADGDAESIFSIDHLKPISKVFDADDELTTKLGEDHPLVIEFEYADGAGDGTYMVAPRIKG